MIKRIYLSELELTELTTTEEESRIFPSPEITYSLLPTATTTYGGLPSATTLSFAVPTADLPRVSAWFTGDYHGVTLPASDTLTKNMQNAVLSVLSTYFANATAENLFTSPFRIGWRFKLFDNTYVVKESPTLLIPNASAPYLVITDYSLTETRLTTAVKIINNPCSLQIAIAPLADAESFADAIEKVEFFITRPTALYASTATVSGVRSVTIDEERTSIWYYESYPAETVAANAMADEDFRLIGEISFAEFAAGGTLTMPSTAGLLQRLSTLEKVTLEEESETVTVTGWRPYRHFMTPALDLDLPDEDKRINAVTLHGEYQRDKAVVTLYGAKHRGEWMQLAAAAGGGLRGLNTGKLRWLRCEVEVRLSRDEYLDALSISYKRKSS